MFEVEWNGNEESLTFFTLKKKIILRKKKMRTYKGFLKDGNFPRPLETKSRMLH